MSGAGGPLLRLEGLVVAYGADPPVIRGVSVALDSGEVAGLIGPSGAGKSTLLRAVQRLVEPAAGRVYLEDVEVTALGRRELRRARRRMGMIFQDHALVERLTVMENVLAGTLGRTGFWRSVRRRFAPDDVEDAFALLERVGMAGYEDRRCDELSGGQKQRVGIARALLQHPRVLLVDEPTASLDPAAAARVMSLVTELCEERGLAALINLHDVPLARRFCPRILGLHQGRIVFDGPAAELDDDVLRTVYGEEAVGSHTASATAPSAGSGLGDAGSGLGDEIGGGRGG